MKKQFGLPLMLASVLAFSACSSEDVTPNGGGNISELTNGGYVKMSINLPSRTSNGGFKGTDQTDKVQLEDGLAKEYNVKNAILVLFQGDDESGAAFHSAYDISTSMQLDKDNDHVTSTTKLVKQVNVGGEANPITGNHLYALVVLNNNGLFQVDADHSLNIKSTTGFSGETFEKFNGTFSQFKGLKSRGNFYTNDNSGILMMNAPLYTKAGGVNDPAGAQLNTLADVTSKVYNTENEAQNNPGAEIFVERAVAKVTMDPNITNKTLTGDEYSAADKQIEASLASWGLDYTNTISYLMHNASPAAWLGYKTMGDASAQNYRFVGNTEVKTGYGYRAYWGIDPNYEAADGQVASYVGGDENFNHIKDDSKLTSQTGDDYPQYCMENTFNVKNMNEDQTTRAIVKVKLTPKNAGQAEGDGSFYIINNDKSKLFDLANLKNLIISDFILTSNAVTTEALTSGAATVDPADVELKENGTVVSVESFKVKYANVADKKDYTDATEVNNAIKTITKYVGGYAYYPIRIKHFNDLTPWTSALHTEANRYDNDNEDKFLGRYGVLRNNWYSLVVNSISGIGSATIPDAPGTPDDELNSYISVRINVLSWAKRTQKEDL